MSGLTANQQKLNEAINTLHEYASRNLKHGWTIEIRIDSECGETSVSLLDGSGEEFEFDPDDSAFESACTASHELSFLYGRPEDQE